MSAALDTLNTDDQALLKAMQADTDEPGDAPIVPVPDPAPTPEPAAPEPQAKEPDARVVPKGALDEERTLRKKAQRELNEERVKAAAEAAKLQTRFEMLAQAVEASTKAPAAEVAPPAFDTDPKAWIDHNVRELNRKQEALDKRLAELSTGATQLNDQQRQQQAVAELQMWGDMQEREFAKSTPDYQKAVEHLQAAKVAELQAVGIEDPSQISAMIRQAVINTADVARRNGRNFAEVLYATAKANGYRPADDALTAATRQAAASPADSAAERLIRGGDMATTLSSTGGAARGQTPVSVIADMDDVEFGKVLAKLKGNPAAIRSLMGS